MTKYTTPFLLSLFFLGCGGDPTPVTPTDTGVDAVDGATDADASTHGPLGFSPSNVDEGKLDFSGLTSDLVWDADYCGNTLSLTDSGKTQCDGEGTKYKFLDYSDGKNRYAVFVARNIRIDAGQTVALSGTRPIILVALETIEILGHLDGEPGLAGGALQGIGIEADGPGLGGGRYAGTPGKRGGGAGFCGLGGAAGASLASGGKTYGTPELVPLLGGSSGGGPYPGAGGAAVQLVAGRKIHVGPSGRVHVPGGGGHSALNLGGGGGSGGAILLESKEIVVAGSLTANGGGGGSNNGGGDGEKGQPSAVAAKGDTAGTEGAGGAGSAGTTLTGGAGTGVAAEAGNGGGAAGWVRFNTLLGTPTVTGVVSPALGTTCAANGRLRM
ncbi:MAG: hypothetical protein IPJ34_05725 [Myxococcales bacterium]|nr:hypothetical protein [Myxococcales bacterium]